MKYEYEIYMHSHLVWNVHWENEVTWRNEMGGWLLKPRTVLKPLTTNSTNTTSY